MSYENFAEWPAWGKEFFTPNLELQNISNRVLGKLTQENLDVGSSNVATTVKYAQNINKDKKTDDTIKSNMDYVSEVCAKNLEYTQNVFKIFANAIEDVQKWSKENVSEALKETKMASGSKK
jgi:hypothetical protein